jgi:molecular chaperone GrpE
LEEYVSNTKNDNNHMDEAVEVDGSVEITEEISDVGESNSNGSTPGDEGLELQLQQALEEAADLKDRMLRLAADYENFKKRSDRERATAMKYAGEHIFREILPVVDNLERAVGQGVVEGASAEQNLAGLLEGVELTLKSLSTSLEKFEVTPITSVGEPFDPNKQEALTMESSETIPADHVLAEFEKGYFYKDRLLRAAKVIVSSGKA